MKKSTKIVAFLLMIILSFSAFAISAFAAESAEELIENSEASSKKIEIDFNPDRFVDSLQYMWKGMLCIFIVIGAIILSIYALNKATNAIIEKRQSKAKERDE